VKMEKNVMRSMELVGRERMEVAVRTSTSSTAWRSSANANPSNNFPSGEKDAMTTYLMSRTSLAF